MKKSTKILLLIIFLLILSFSIYFILNQNNTHSLTFVKKVNQYSKNQTNYSVVISKNIDNTNFTENIIFNNGIKKIIYKTGDNITDIRWITSDKIISEYSKIYVDSSFVPSDLDTLDIYLSGNYTYKFLREETYNNLKCIVSEFTNKNSNEKTVVWIDIERKLLVKQEIYDNNNQLTQSFTYNITLNNVTDEDVKLPDLTNYTYQKQ